MAFIRGSQNVGGVQNSMLSPAKIQIAAQMDAANQQALIVEEQKQQLGFHPRQNSNVVRGDGGDMSDDMESAG